MKAILDNHMVKQGLVGAALGAIGGILFGSLPWVIGLTVLGAILGVTIDLIDQAFYKPESKGGGQHTVALTGVIVLVLVSVITALLIWFAAV